MLKFIGKFQIASLQMQVCGHEHVHLSERPAREGAQIHLLCQMFGCYVETHASSLTSFSHTVTTNPLFHTHLCKLMALSINKVLLLYRLAWNCALEYPLPAKKISRTYCIPPCSWSQEEGGILAVQLLLGFAGLEGIRESLMEAADPGPAEQERENQTQNFFGGTMSGNTLSFTSHRRGLVWIHLFILGCSSCINCWTSSSLANTSYELHESKINWNISLRHIYSSLNYSPHSSWWLSYLSGCRGVLSSLLLNFVAVSVSDSSFHPD